MRLNEITLNTDFNELVTDDQFAVTAGTIVFPEYENLLNQAHGVYDFLSTIEVTEDSVKQSKKLVAGVNKASEKLNDRRVAAKKALLKPYTEFECQIKEITGVLKDADTLVRDQVNHLEDAEKEKKLEDIKELFAVKLSKRDRQEFYSFDDFMCSKFLNKTCKMSSIEIDMADWFKKTDADVTAIETLSPDIRSDVAAEYQLGHDFAAALSEVNTRNARKEQIRQQERETEQARTEQAEANGVQAQKMSREYVFTVHSEKDKTLTELLLKGNGIEFTYSEH